LTVSAQFVGERDVTGADESGQPKVHVVEDPITAVLRVDGQGYFALELRCQICQVPQLLFRGFSFHAQLTELAFGGR
jgi:hypothetical protein